MKRIFIPFAAAALCIISCGNPSAKDSVDKADSANAAKSDSAAVKTDTTTHPVLKTDATSTEFLVKAANGGLAEVKLGQLARDKATSSAVKEFAEMMIADHGAANEKVKKLAAERNVTLPAEPDAEHQKKADDLSKKTGKDFDKAYVDAMVKGHEETVDMFKKDSGRVTDAGIKSFIDNTLPTLEHHLERIKEIKKGMK